MGAETETETETDLLLEDNSIYYIHKKEREREKGDLGPVVPSFEASVEDASRREIGVAKGVFE